MSQNISLVVLHILSFMVLVVHFKYKIDQHGCYVSWNLTFLVIIHSNLECQSVLYTCWKNCNL